MVTGLSNPKCCQSVGDNKAKKEDNRDDQITGNSETHCLVYQHLLWNENVDSNLYDNCLFLEPELVSNGPVHAAQFTNLFFIN